MSEKEIDKIYGNRYYRHSGEAYATYMLHKASTQDIVHQLKRNNELQMVNNAVIGSAIIDGQYRMMTGIQSSISSSTYQIIASQNLLKEKFNEGFNSINNTLDFGFAGIDASLGKLSASFEAGLEILSSSIDKLNEDICNRLDSIQEALKKPLFTEARELYDRAVINYSKKLFQESLNDLLKAVELNPTDYFAWFLLGRVYLYGASEFGSVINPTEASLALLKATKYITSDIAVNEEAARLASEIYFHLSYAKYIESNEYYANGNIDSSQQLLLDVISAAEKSYQLSSGMLESLYNIARAQLFLGDKEKCLKTVKKLIILDQNYCLRIESDIDFESIKPDFYTIVNQLNKDEYIQAKSKYDEIKQKVSEIVFIGGWFADNLSTLIEKYVPDDFPETLPYFDNKEANSHFNNILNLLKIEAPCDRPVSSFQVGEQFEHTELASKLYEGHAVTAVFGDHDFMLWNYDYEALDKKGEIHNLTSLKLANFKKGDFLKTKILRTVNTKDTIAAHLGNIDTGRMIYSEHKSISPGKDWIICFSEDGSKVGFSYIGNQLDSQLFVPIMDSGNIEANSYTLGLAVSRNVMSFIYLDSETLFFYPYQFPSEALVYQKGVIQKDKLVKHKSEDSTNKLPRGSYENLLVVLKDIARPTWKFDHSVWDCLYFSMRIIEEMEANKIQDSTVRYHNKKLPQNIDAAAIVRLISMDSQALNELKQLTSLAETQYRRMQRKRIKFKRNRFYLVLLLLTTMLWFCPIYLFFKIVGTLVCLFAMFITSGDFFRD